VDHLVANAGVATVGVFEDAHDVTPFAPAMAFKAQTLKTTLPFFR
jgi:hypothetical protein